MLDWIYRVWTKRRCGFFSKSAHARHARRTFRGSSFKVRIAHTHPAAAAPPHSRARRCARATERIRAIARQVDDGGACATRGARVHSSVYPTWLGSHARITPTRPSRRHINERKFAGHYAASWLCFVNWEVSTSSVVSRYACASRSVPAPSSAPAAPWRARGSPSAPGRCRLRPPYSSVCMYQTGSCHTRNTFATLTARCVSFSLSISNNIHHQHHLRFTRGAPLGG